MLTDIPGQRRGHYRIAQLHLRLIQIRLAHGDIRLGVFQSGRGVIQIQLAGGVLLVQRFQAFHVTSGLGRLGLAFLQLGFRLLYPSTIFIGINHKQGLILLHPFTFLKQHFL